MTIGAQLITVSLWVVALLMRPETNVCAEPPQFTAIVSWPTCTLRDRTCEWLTIRRLPVAADAVMGPAVQTRPQETVLPEFRFDLARPPPEPIALRRLP